MNKIVHLLSGGLDSVTMLYDLKAQDRDVHCLLCDYKQRHVQEITFAKAHCHRLGVMFTTMELPALKGLTQENWIVPNRNAVLLSLAVNLAFDVGADTVTIGCNADDALMFPDCRAPFLRAMSKAISTAGYKIKVWAPYLLLPKRKIAEKARVLLVPLEDIWTCYRGGAKPCGKCPACLKLEEALCGA